MGQAAVSHQVVGSTAAGSGFLIPGAVDESRDAGLRDCPRAHHAGLQGDHEGVAVEAVVSKGYPRLSKRHDFRVAGGVAVSVSRVVTGGDDVAVWADDDGSDGNIPVFGGAGGLVEGTPHPLFPLGLVVRCHPSKGRAGPLALG